MALTKLFDNPPPGAVPAPVVEVVAPTYPQVLPATPASVADLQSFLKDSGKLVKRPKRMSASVWDLAQEYMQEGGLLDLGEEIASLAELEVRVRESELPLDKKADLLIKLNDKRATAKEKYLKVQEARKSYLTLDMFAVFLDDLYGVLLKNIGDEVLLKKIGSELNASAMRLRTRMRSG